MSGRPYTGPGWLDAQGRREWTALRARFPEVYKVPGVGWCGPGWEEMGEAERALLQAAREREDQRPPA